MNARRIRSQWWLAMAGAALVASMSLAGCGSATNVASAAPVPTPASAAAAVPAPAHLTISVLPGGRMGPNEKVGHDAYSPYAFTVYAGQKVDMTALDYDNMPHSMTAFAAGTKLAANEVPGGVANANPGGLLVLNQQFTKSKTGNIDMTPGVTHFTFTAPTEPGTYYFQCIDPCDMSNQGWSMSHYGYMIGKLVVVSDPS